MVLLHGLGVDHRMWMLQLPVLQEAGRVWPLDLPGFGLEPPLEPRSWTPEAYADWVADRLRSRLSGAAHLVGYSMGGTLCLLLALRHPQIVTTLSLCCSSACWGRGGRRHVAALFAGLGGRLSMEVFEWSVRRGYARHRKDPAERLRLSDMTQKAHRPTMLALYKALARTDLRPGLPEVRVPALVVGGERDWLAPPSHLSELARGLRNSTLSVVRGADHLLCVSHPSLLSTLLFEFLNRRWAGPATGSRTEAGA